MRKRLSVLVTGCFGAQGPVAPARGKEVKECMCRMNGVFNDVLCLLSSASSVQVLEGGQGAPKTFFVCFNCLLRKVCSVGVKYTQFGVAILCHKFRSFHL